MFISLLDEGKKIYIRPELVREFIFGIEDNRPYLLVHFVDGRTYSFFDGDAVRNQEALIQYTSKCN
jgi:hypothetical protein